MEDKKLHSNPPRIKQTQENKQHSERGVTERLKNPPGNQRAYMENNKQPCSPTKMPGRSTQGVGNQANGIPLESQSKPNKLRNTLQEKLKYREHCTRIVSENLAKILRKTAHRQHYADLAWIKTAEQREYERKVKVRKMKHLAAVNKLLENTPALQTSSEKNDVAERKKKEVLLESHQVHQIEQIEKRKHKTDLVADQSQSKGETLAHNSREYIPDEVKDRKKIVYDQMLDTRKKNITKELLAEKKLRKEMLDKYLAEANDRRIKREREVKINKDLTDAWNAQIPLKQQEKRGKEESQREMRRCLFEMDRWHEAEKKMVLAASGGKASCESQEVSPRMSPN
ncbi:golgin subfamily A member 6-like protein 6 [Fundulus heteroclitus]|uniref:golgin subfamily A member 6-like protein 6 n=1 Tax=Fundulus heteroclitus TaxID=8078 RepID=UPI00165AB427|nr:golgin subfamily A member 6-like protein 6 [Fundulus heteroclitus]